MTKNSLINLSKAGPAVYQTGYGVLFQGLAEEVLIGNLDHLKGKVQLIFTSPPFPLNTKKAYGNLNGEQYLTWLSDLASIFCDFLKDDGSLVIELGNCWEDGLPTMSTLGLKALLNLQENNNLHLCQEFICHNPARLPSPAQWVTIERIRVKDSFTRLWWLSKNPRPKANNRNVLQEYSKSMERLLKRKSFNSGKRPSEHHISTEAFNIDNGGAIAANVLSIPNTLSNDPYQTYCREKGIQFHPARMPAELVDFFIKFLTDEDDIVLDPFGGSNTTGATAEGLRRKWIAIEPKDDYIKGSLGRFDLNEVDFVDKSYAPLNVEIGS